MAGAVKSGIYAAAKWAAMDVARQKRHAPGRLLSIHDRVINLKVEGQVRLLMLTHPLLPRGPACVGLSAALFNRCRDLLSRGAPLHRAPEALYLGEGQSTLIIHWRSVPVLSFAPPARLKKDLCGITRALFFYEQLLRDVKSPTAAAVLLQAGGPDPYFRQRIGSRFPGLVESLRQKDEQEFRRRCIGLAGMGRGSTPTGDDLIFGALVAAHYYGRMEGESAAAPIPLLPFEAICRTTLPGAHMLELGQGGLAPQPVRQFILSIFRGRPRAAILHNLLKMGSGSGYDIAVALLYTLKFFVQNGARGRAHCIARLT